MEKYPGISNVQVVRRRERPTPATMSRRDFVTKGSLGLANVAIAGVGLNAYRTHHNTAVAEKQHQADAVEALVEEAVMEGESQSRYFDSSVEGVVATLNEQEEDIEAERGAKTTIEHIDVIQAILEHGQLDGIESELVRDRLERMLPAIAFTESRFDVDALNEESGTFGAFQLTPGTWADHAEEGDTKESLASQIKVAARLLEQTYRYITGSCATELAAIKENFFNGDDEAFEEYFMVPVMVNAYLAGMGTLAEVIQSFCADYQTPEELRHLSPDEVYLTGRDVFSGMSQAARGLQWSANYSEKSAAYTYKPYAAYKVITDDLAAFVDKQRV